MMKIKTIAIEIIAFVLKISRVLTDRYIRKLVTYNYPKLLKHESGELGYYIWHRHQYLENKCLIPRHFEIVSEDKIIERTSDLRLIILNLKIVSGYYYTDDAYLKGHKVVLSARNFLSKFKMCEYENELINEIYEIIQKYTAMFCKDIWADCLNLICDDLVKYDFDKVSSVPVHVKADDETTENLRKVSLLQHTYNVVKTIEVTLIKTRDSALSKSRLKIDYSFHIKLLVAGLLHDFGKNENLVNVLGLSRNNKFQYHSESSANYGFYLLYKMKCSENHCSSAFEKFEKEFNDVLKTVKNSHHKIPKNNRLTKCLIYADRFVRGQEKEMRPFFWS